MRRTVGVGSSAAAGCAAWARAKTRRAAASAAVHRSKSGRPGKRMTQSHPVERRVSRINGRMIVLRRAVAQTKFGRPAEDGRLADRVAVGLVEKLDTA